MPGRMLATPRTSRTRGSFRSESVSALRPGRRRAASAASPSGSCTTTRIGWMTPLAPMSRSAASPCPDSDWGGNQLVAGRPRRICVRGKLSSAIATPPNATARQGRCPSQRAQRSQPVGAWNRASGRASHLGRSMFRPSTASSAGRNVVASSTATATTSSPPTPTERVSDNGVVTSAAKPTTTVSPDVITIETAGSAVITSGLTVVVGFAALVTTPLSDTRSVGVGGLLVVAVAVLLATTFLPALLAVLGRNIDRPKWLARPLARFHAPTGWERWARWLGHRPWRAVAFGGVAIALLSFPLTQIRLGLPATNWFPPQSESGQGLAALRDMGASGVIQPIRVVVQLPEGEAALAARRLPGLKALTDSLRKDPRVREVRGVASIRPGLSTLQLAIYYSDPAAARAKNAKFFDAYLSADQRITLLDVIPADTVSLAGMMDVARHVRAVVARGVRGLAGTEIVVGGFAASNVDTQQELLRRFPQTVGLVLGITAIMLFGAFRSLLVPLKAVLLNCLSVGASFGLTVLVFQHGYGGRLFGLEGPTEAIWVVVPVLVFAIVFGLSMDYEVFLLTRVKEVFDKTGRNDYATMEGLSATASTITSAALIMILVFGTFAFARVLAVQLVGFGIAAAVLLDATLIRMVLVPAIMHIAGRWNWWPGVRAPKLERETSA